MRWSIETRKTRNDTVYVLSLLFTLLSTIFFVEILRIERASDCCGQISGGGPVRRWSLKLRQNDLTLVVASTG